MIQLMIISLFIIGVILIVVELFITPGFVVGLLGMGFIAAGIYSIYSNYGNGAGNVALVTVSAIMLVFLVLALRTGFWSRIASNESITGKANEMNSIPLAVGEYGEALSALRPSGTALFKGKRYEVQSEGAFIDTNEEIIITKILENKIYVKLKT